MLNESLEDSLIKKEQEASWVAEDEVENNDEEVEFDDSEAIAELEARKAEHDYEVLRDARMITLETYKVRRLGAIEHLLRSIVNELAESNRIMRKRIRELNNEENEGGTPIKDDEVDFKKQVLDLFDIETRKNLSFTFDDRGVKISPLKFLGTPKWIELCQKVDNFGGSWIKNDKNSKENHWYIKK